MNVALILAGWLGVFAGIYIQLFEKEFSVMCYGIAGSRHIKLITVQIRWWLWNLFESRVESSYFLPHAIHRGRMRILVSNPTGP